MKILKLFRKEEPIKTIESTERLYDEETHLDYFNHPCPKCNSFPVYYDFTCHTYFSSGRWSSCLPCSSAGYLTCNNENCDWSYTWGHNPENPRFADEEKYRPEWLVGDWPY